jgi:hypothetical protein
LVVVVVAVLLFICRLVVVGEVQERSEQVQIYL